MASTLTEPLLPDSDEGHSDAAELINNESLLPSTTDDVGEQQGERRAPKMSTFFGLTVMIVCTPMFLFGFNTGVLNAPEAVIFPGHTALEWSIAVSAFCAGGFFGANVAGNLSDRFGRRRVIMVILMGNLLFGILHYAATNMTVLIVARFGVGLAGGASTVVTPMMLSEISPKEIRGTICTLTQLSCVLGILASALWAIPFCTADKWPLIFVPIPILSLLGLFASPCCLPESPRWLLLNHYETRGQEARNVLRLFRKDNITEEVFQLLGVEGEPSSNLEDSEPPMPTSSDHAEPLEVEQDEELADNSFRAYARDPRNRIALASSILFPIAQQLSGINAVFYYSTSFFEGVISNPHTGTLIAFFVNVVATLVALALMDRLGRKTLLGWSAGGMFICCVLLTLALKGVLPGYVTVIAVMLYISFFEMGLGCIPFFLASEMIEPEHLATVQSISMSSNWFSNFCVGILFPSMDKALGAYSFVPFAIVLFFTVLYSLFVLPETRGKTVQEVMQELNQRQSRDRAQSVVSLSRQRQSTEAETVLV